MKNRRQFVKVKNVGYAYAVRRENEFKMAGFLKHLAMRYAVSNICKKEVNQFHAKCACFG